MGLVYSANMCYLGTICPRQKESVSLSVLNYQIERLPSWILAVLPFFFKLSPFLNYPFVEWLKSMHTINSDHRTDKWSHEVMEVFRHPLHLWQYQQILISSRNQLGSSIFFARMLCTMLKLTFWLPGQPTIYNKFCNWTKPAFLIRYRIYPRELFTGRLTFDLDLESLTFSCHHCTHTTVLNYDYPEHGTLGKILCVMEIAGLVHFHNLLYMEIDVLCHYPKKEYIMQMRIYLLLHKIEVLHVSESYVFNCRDLSCILIRVHAGN